MNNAQRIRYVEEQAMRAEETLAALCARVATRESGSTAFASMTRDARAAIVAWSRAAARTATSSTDAEVHEQIRVTVFRTLTKLASKATVDSSSGDACD